MQEKLATFGDRMRAARLRKRYTQQRIAEYCGEQTHMTVSNWEHGRNFPSLESLVLTAGLYEVSIDWLIWGGDVAQSIDARLRKIPEILRAGLTDRLHAEIDKTEELAKRLPPEMAGAVVKDSDVRLKSWAATNKKAMKRHNQ